MNSEISTICVFWPKHSKYKADQLQMSPDCRQTDRTFGLVILCTTCSTSELTQTDRLLQKRVKLNVSSVLHAQWVLFESHMTWCLELSANILSYTVPCEKIEPMCNSGGKVSDYAPLHMFFSRLFCKYVFQKDHASYQTVKSPVWAFSKGFSFLTLLVLRCLVKTDFQWGFLKKPHFQF